MIAIHSGALVTDDSIKDDAFTVCAISFLALKIPSEK